MEISKAPPGGRPPVLTVGDDDIYWVAQLHTALLAKGYYPPDDECEDWCFGDGTQVALLSFQSCEGLEESGGWGPCGVV